MHQLPIQVTLLLLLLVQLLTTHLQEQLLLLYQQLQQPTGSMFQVTADAELQYVLCICEALTWLTPTQGVSSVFSAVSNTKDNPPCNTLFVGNLGDTVSEAELRQLFGTLAGFRQLKLIRGARSVTCFVEFNDLPSAMACHQNQQVC